MASSTGARWVKEPKYNHAFTLSFSVDTDCTCQGEDYPEASTVRKEIIDRLNDLSDDELMEVIGVPFDSILNHE